MAYVKGLENLTTVIGKNGEIMQGHLEWILDERGFSKDEFWFSVDGKLANRVWCKLDYWRVKQVGIGFGRIVVEDGN